MRTDRLGRIIAAVVVLPVAMALSACDGDLETPVAPTAGPPVQSGKLRRWPEAGAHLTVDLGAKPASVDLGTPRGSGLDAFWSIASTRGAGSGFFYSDKISGGSETRIAEATSVRRVADIRDASAFDYSRASVGPVAPGAIVLLHHVPSGKYLAIVVDAIEAVDPRTVSVGPYAYADVTWYLTADQSADFSSAP
jgi:hypothetical protein